MHDRQLDTFKTVIDLRAYATGQGYRLDRKASWAGSAVMRHVSGDKGIIRRGADGHYVYFSVGDDRDYGAIIDFAQKKTSAYSRRGSQEPPGPRWGGKPLHPIHRHRDHIRWHTALAGSFVLQEPLRDRPAELPASSARLRIATLQVVSDLVGL
jgi:hypothetical protein